MHISLLWILKIPQRGLFRLSVPGLSNIGIRNQPNKLPPFFSKVLKTDAISWGVINSVFLTSLMWNNFGLWWNKFTFINESETIMWSLYRKTSRNRSILSKLALKHLGMFTCEDFDLIFKCCPWTSFLVLFYFLGAPPSFWPGDGS